MRSKLDGWITGIRKEHSKNRNSMQMFQIDEQHGGILKINPIIDWSLEQIMEQFVNGKYRTTHFWIKITLVLDAPHALEP